MISLSRTALLNLAQLLEARCDPIFIAQELRALIAAAKPSGDSALIQEMAQEIRSFGSCRSRLHSRDACECRYCRLLARAQEERK